MAAASFGPNSTPAMCAESRSVASEMRGGLGRLSRPSAAMFLTPCSGPACARVTRAWVTETDLLAGHRQIDAGLSGYSRKLPIAS
ncbi:hypothetical protein GCM10010252_32180 [Streptomyces aureoverticillatus]|nr:hypothetical protein GCM10010252_32180 [Streptomyces aureoverticillatus]